MRRLTHGTERCGRGALRATALLTLLTALLVAPATAGAATAGGLKQLGSTKGCHVDDAEVGVTGCEEVRALQNVGRIAVSPDGKHVYAPSRTANAVVVFDRNTTTGALTQKAGADGCYTSTAGDGCSTGPPSITGLTGANAVALDSTGANLYVASPGSPGGLATFRRLSDGTLVFLSTVTAAIVGISQVAVSPDGKSIYVTSTDRGGIIGNFSRAPDGTPSFAGCFAVDTSFYGGCVSNTLMTGPNDVAVSPDNKQVIVANETCCNWDVLAFDRNTGTGAITYAGGPTRCISSNTSPPAGCAVRVGIYYPRSIAFDGNSRFYLAGQYAVTRIDRDPATGAITASSNTAGCATYSDSSPAQSCTPTLPQSAFFPHSDVVVRPGASNVYSGSQSGNPTLFGYSKAGNGDISLLPTPLGCSNVSASNGCTTFRQGVAVNGLAIDNGGKNLYASGGNRLFSFNFDRPPVCQNVAVGTANTASVTVTFSCSDPDGDALTFEKVTDPSRGTLAGIQGSTVSYGPQPGTTGVDSFQYRARAGGVASDPATASINVTAPPTGGGGTTPPPTGGGGGTVTTLSSTTSINSLGFKKFTKLLNLSVKNLPAGATVRVTCKTKKKKQQKKGCAYKSKRFTTSGARASLNLRKPFAKKRIPVGTKITITITAPGFLGKQIQYTTRAGKIPKSRVRCLSASGKAGSCA